MSKVNVAIDLKKQEAKKKVNTAKTKAAAANSVPALREAVLNLIETVEYLQTKIY